MLYPNWDAAWYDYQLLWVGYQNWWRYAYDYNVQALVHGFGAAGFADLLNAQYDLINAVGILFGLYYDTFGDAICNNLFYYSGSPTLDFDTLLNVMLTPDISQLTQFVGIEDAYRSAIWDQPFNAQFYAALAQGFRAQL